MGNYYKITFVFGVIVDFDDNPSLLIILYLQNRPIITECVAFTRISCQGFVKRVDRGGRKLY